MKERGPDLSVCPTLVERAAMIHWWLELTFLHWRFDPQQVQRLLPPGLEVQTWDGAAWVGLVPFFMRVGLPKVRPIPWVSNFAETNVRTYVRDARGETGVWFFSLDAARLGAVVVARTTYQLPYFWSDMEIERRGDTITYNSRRRWPSPRGVRSTVEIEIGEPYRADELTAFDHYLTARWSLFSTPRSGLHLARAFHDPWRLHRARALRVDDELVRAAGLVPEGDPLVHFSPGVEVRIGWPSAVEEAR